MGVKVASLPDCPLVLSLLKHRNVRGIYKLKNEESKQRKISWRLVGKCVLALSHALHAWDEAFF